LVDNIVRDEAGHIRFHYVLVDLLAEYTGGELTAASDISDARWVGGEELAELDVTEKARELVLKVLRSAP
jgi:8-oxo-dGTP diphosphatase